VSEPTAIERLVPEMQKDEPFESRLLSDADGYHPKSYTAAELMLTIVGNSPAFDGKTRKWAQDNANLHPEKRQPMVRQWWKENEGFFTTAEYKSVKPGEDLMAE